MTSPATYAGWATLLDQFAGGDDTALGYMSSGSFVVDAGTASRFYARVEQAYKKRKQHWLDGFRRSLRLQQFKTVDDFAIPLRNGKQNLLPLSRFAAIPAFPANLQQTLQKDLQDFVAEIRSSLKDNVSKTSPGREQMLVLLNSFALAAIRPSHNNDTNNNHPPADGNTSPTGRKIIF